MGGGEGGKIRYMFLLTGKWGYNWGGGVIIGGAYKHQLTLFPLLSRRKIKIFLILVT